MYLSVFLHSTGAKLAKEVANGMNTPSLHYRYHLWYTSEAWSHKIALGWKFWNVVSDAWFWNIVPDVWFQNIASDASQTPARHQPDAMFWNQVSGKISKPCVRRYFLWPCIRRTVYLSVPQHVPSVTWWQMKFLPQRCKITIQFLVHVYLEANRLLSKAINTLSEKIAHSNAYLHLIHHSVDIQVNKWRNQFISGMHLIHAIPAWCYLNPLHSM